MIQGGDPLGQGYGGPGLSVRGRVPPRPAPRPRRRSCRWPTPARTPTAASSSSRSARRRISIAGTPSSAPSPRASTSSRRSARSRPTATIGPSTPVVINKVTIERRRASEVRYARPAPEHAGSEDAQVRRAWTLSRTPEPSRIANEGSSLTSTNSSYNRAAMRRARCPDRPTPNWRFSRVLWTRGPSTVRQVHEALADARETGYTTTLKLMQIMAEKGLVTRDESARTHVYAARVVARRDAAAARVAIWWTARSAARPRRSCCRRSARTRPRPKSSPKSKS